MPAEPTSNGRLAQANRGNDTRERLIHAALELFGAYGFDGASTRMLAERAGANLAAIPYYFGGKEGLYRAAAEFVVAVSKREMQPAIEKVERAMAGGKLTRPAAAALLQEMLERFSNLVIASHEADTWASFVMREQIRPGAAFEILYEGLMSRVMGAAVGLLAIALGARPDDTRLIVKTEAIFGQILVFRACRAAVLRKLGWEEISEAGLKIIQTVVRENVARITGQGR